MTEITSHMVERYFRGESPEEEAAAVWEWLKEHPEALDHYLTDDKWEEFREAGYLPDTISSSMYEQIEAHIQQRRKRTGWRLPAVAAMLVAIVAIWFASRPDEQPRIVQVPVLPVVETAAFIENTTGNPIEHQLPDGSKVILATGATIRFKKPFPDNRRDVTLTGKARFDVAKDPAPFTVFAGKTGTTALGTVFEISSLPGATTTVLLISGKVKVQTEERDVILRPGEQLRYNDALHTVQVTRPDAPVRSVSPSMPPVQPKQRIPATAALQFDNTPLVSLFRQLEARENLTVLFDPALLRDRYFTGSFNSGKESLDDFLQTIAVLNNLQIRHSGDTVMIDP